MKLLLFLFVLLLSSAAQAQDSGIVTIPPGDDVIIDLGKGEPAPYPGQLFNDATAMRWGFWLQQYRLRLKLDTEKEQKECKVKLDFKDKELRISQHFSNLKIKDLRARVLRTEKRAVEAEDDARNPSFFKTVTFGVIMGMVVTGGITALVAWGINQKGG